MRASNHAIARTASTQIDQYAANPLSELTANTAHNWADIACRDDRGAVTVGNEAPVWQGR
jgi:hypothetical protein